MTQRPLSEQLPLSLPHGNATGWDDLVVGDPLHAATAIIRRWPDWPSPVVVLTGPEGSGKSHLAALWRARSGAQPIHPLADSEAVAQAAEGPVLFEDADREPFDETTLFHVINAVRSNATSLLITARSWPMGWNVALPDLASRLKAATVVEIGPPDDALLLQVLFKLFADRQLTIDERLATYLVSRMERTLAAAQSIVDRLDRLALARGTRVTRALAAEVLNDYRSGETGGDA
jgi:chromosomal replication initiation ATPase DnaA